MPIDLLLKEAKGMTDDSLMEVIHYMRYLKIRSTGTRASGHAAVASNGKRILREPGLYHGAIKMTDDFDAPLDDFKEYM